MSDTEINIQVKDVYDNASDIFQEFQKIIEITGADIVSALIHKVQNVLELLEESVKKLEQLDKDLADINLRCSHLSSDKLAKEEEVQNLKQASEELEESWMNESLKLETCINKLTAENKILNQRLSEKKDDLPEIDNSLKLVIEDQENVISKLKSTLKQKDSRFEKDQVTIEEMSAKIDHLMTVNKSLHQNYQEAQSSISTFKMDKKNSEERINSQNEKLESMNSSLKDLQKTMKETLEFNLQTLENVYKPVLEKQRCSEERLNTVSEENEKLKQECKHLKHELSLLQSQINKRQQQRFSTPVQRNQERVTGHGHIDQIFRLFLGVFPPTTQTCDLRNQRMCAA